MKRQISKRLMFFTWFLVLLPVSAPAQIQIPVDQSGKPSLAPILAEVTPAVVNIAVTSRQQAARNPLFDDPVFRRFFNIPERGPIVPRQSAGSGVIVDAQNGYVVTNHHVVLNAEEIVVTLQDRRQLNATLIGSDAGTDIALLQIEANNLQSLDLGNSDELRVGDFVLAIGNPFGIGQTVTSGIVSALGRSGLNIEGYEDFIQTDASINPGNSGGPLIDLESKVIGINTAIITPAGGNVGIGFAIPSNMVRTITAQLAEYGEVRRGRLGIMIQDITPDLAQALDLDVDSGALVTQVESGSSAENAGLIAGDVIVAVNEEVVRGSADLRNRIGLVRAGTQINLGVLRDGRQQNISAVIGDAPQQLARQPEVAQKLEGAVYAELPATHQLYGKVKGVLVTSVEQDSRAWRAGLRTGDIILGINRQAIASVNELTTALESAGSTFALDIMRNEARLFIVIQ